jgi:D-alanyl-D-alanine dipeptidase
MDISLRPIPVRDTASDTGGYRAIPVNRDDRRFSEPLVRLADHGIAGESYYARTDGGNEPYCRPIRGSIRELLARATIAVKLNRVNRALAARRLELFVWDAYRPLACQQGLWDFFRERIRAIMPDASQDAASAEVRRYVADPDHFRPEDSTSWPSHATGGSVDLTLRDCRTGDLLPMGAGFDEMNEKAHTHYLEGLLQGGEIAADDVRLLNRRLLYWSMADEGFTNYAYEYWHFDYGNQMHIMTLAEAGAPASAAWYGYVQDGGA